MSEREEWLTVAEVVAELKMHEETIRRWIREGRLPATRIGSNRAGYRVRRSDVDRVLAEGIDAVGKVEPVAV